MWKTLTIPKYRWKVYSLESLQHFRRFKSFQNKRLWCVVETIYICIHIFLSTEYKHTDTDTHSSQMPGTLPSGQGLCGSWGTSGRFYFRFCIATLKSGSCPGSTVSRCLFSTARCLSLQQDHGCDKHICSPWPSTSAWLSQTPGCLSQKCQCIPRVARIGEYSVSQTD